MSTTSFWLQLEESLAVAYLFGAADIATDRAESGLICQPVFKGQNSGLSAIRHV